MKKVEACHSEQHEQGVRASILREADVVGHEGQREGAGKGNWKERIVLQGDRSWGWRGFRRSEG